MAQIGLRRGERGGAEEDRGGESQVGCPDSTASSPNDMAHQFQKHYTRDEARELLPQLRVWLKRLAQLQVDLASADERLSGLIASGSDLGGQLVNTRVRTIANLEKVLLEFRRREIQIKDFERGLVDFPAIIAGKEVFLCWEQDEEDVEFWHDLDAGYAGRERL